MRTLLFSLVISSVVAGTAAADTPKEIVDKATKAHGGKAAHEKFQGTKYDFAAQITTMGLDIDLKGTSIAADGGKLKMNMEGEIMGNKLSIMQVLNGKKIVFKQSLGGMELPTPEAAKEEVKPAAAMMDISKIYPLLDEKRFKLEAGGEEEVDGKKAHVLKVSLLEFKKDMTLFIDKETNLLVKMSRMTAGPMGEGEINRSTVYSDIKTIDGIKVPFKQTVYNDKEKFMTITIKEYKHLEKVDEKEFTIDD
ncbi:MAG: hypothetical protein ACRCZF_09470 [Gemmataceae bacterium]